ncbi:sensor domain-containing diguanylate cyclase [Vibrio proteolyticus]
MKPLNLQNVDTELDSHVLSQVFEHIDTAVIIATLQREIVCINSAAKKLFGFQEGEVIGASTRILYATDDEYETLGLSRYNVEAECISDSYIADYKTKGGRIFQGQTSGGVIKNFSGENLFYIAMIKDESSRLSAEETLNKLHEITSSRQLSFEQRVDEILKLGTEHFGLPIGIFSKIDGNDYIVQRAVHPDDALEIGMTFELDATYCSHVYNADDVQGFHHVSDSEVATHPCFKNFGLEAYLGAPIFVDEKRYGTLNFSSPEPTRPFIRQDIELIRLFAEWVGHEVARNNDLLALENAHVQMESMANTDALTGLANRGCMERILLEQIRIAQNQRTEAVVALLDLDHFKAINDSYGHRTGDEALREFALLASKLCRKEDFCARWGGEEFLIILPRTGLEGGRSLLARLQRELRDVSVTHEDSEVNFTVSVGATVIRQQDSPNELLTRADELLYKAKHKGRNRIETG